MSALGTHVLIDLYGCDPLRLKGVEGVERSMVAAAKAAGATVVQTVFHQFSPYGVSGVVVLAESHLAIHTWPEHRFAAVDLFTCNPAIDADAAIAVLRAAFSSGRHTASVQRRGAAAAVPAN